MRKVVALLALTTVGTVGATYKPGQLCEQRRLAVRPAPIAKQAENAMVQEVVAEVGDVIRPSDILPLIEREITYLLSRKKQ